MAALGITSEILIQRRWFTTQSTIGFLTYRSFSCYTLELPWHENQRMISCIPVGRYPLALVDSPRFGRPMPEVQGVIERSSILIHPGNWPSDTEGCILVGHDRAENSILRAREAFAELFPLIASALKLGSCMITITEAPESDSRYSGPN